VSFTILLSFLGVEDACYDYGVFLLSLSSILSIVIEYSYYIIEYSYCNYRVFLYYYRLTFWLLLPAHFLVNFFLKQNPASEKDRASFLLLLLSVLIIIIEYSYSYN
jgi:hypothetical protein